VGVVSESESACSFCEQGTSCFIDVAPLCPPSSVHVENSDLCVCNAGFFLLDKYCVICTTGYYSCTGGDTDASTTRRRMLSETNYSGSDIEPCPQNSQSISGTDSVSMCLCNSGYTALACAEPPCEPPCTACESGTYKAVVSSVVDCEPCPADTYSSSLHECTACPDSTESPQGSPSQAVSFLVNQSTLSGPAGSCTACEIMLSHSTRT
jgi:hypothetical protein